MPEKWEKIASDFHSPYFRNKVWVDGVCRQPEIFGIPLVNLGMICWSQNIDYVCKPSSWVKAYEFISKKVDEDMGYLENIIKMSVDNGEEMDSYTEKLLNGDLKSYPAEKIMEVYEKWWDYNSKQYAIGIMIPYLDFANYHYVEDHLKDYLKRNLDNEKDIVKYFSVFTQPTKDSFAQEQEKSILNIFTKFYKNKKLLKILEKKPADVLKILENEYPDIFEKLKEHAKKYNWVFHVYAGPAWTEENFIESLQFYKNKKINPEKKLKELEKEREELLEERERLLEKLNPDEKEKRLVNIASSVIYYKPRRKDYQAKSYYHIGLLQKEIGRRLGLSLSQVRSADMEELGQGLDGGEVDIDKINERYKFHIVVNPEGKTEVFIGKSAVDFKDKEVKREERSFEDVSEITGQCACSGKARGVVKRIDKPEDMEKMEDGDILVSTATTPSIVPAIRKAAAIITDEGGLTCHASIVSREFNIPCVVGTEISTKVFKDGDLVEVNADKGIVRKL